jgi:DNA repair exonuclease SbcCD ATPase subunit
MELDSMSDEEIKYYLCQELLEMEMERSRQARDRYGESKEHSEHLKILLDEIKNSEKVIRSHLDTYTKIWEGLKNLGVDKTRLEELNKQLEDVRKTLEECTNAREDCAKVHKAVKTTCRSVKKRCGSCARHSINIYHS